jgi:signal peptidase I
MTAAAPPRPLPALLLGLALPPLGLQYVGANVLGYLCLPLLLVVGLLALLWPNAGLPALIALSIVGGLGSALLASRARLAGDRPRNRAVNLLVTALVFAVVAWAGVRVLVLDVLRVPSVAMAPAVQSGSLLFADVRPRTRAWLAELWPALEEPALAPKPGELWLFDSGRDGMWLKRVIGVPGDRLEVARGRVRLNGVQLDSADDKTPEHFERLGGERYRILLTGGPLDHQTIERQLTDDEFWMMGDNRANSMDSRQLGPIRRDALVGRVVGVLNF